MQRQTATKENIKNAFISLLEQKEFELISVSDIAKMANINRGTFYLHYVDKYDLVQQLVDDIKEEILQKAFKRNSNQTLLDRVTNVFDYLKSEFLFIQLLLKRQSSYFISVIHEFLIEMSQQFPEIKNRLSNDNKLPLDYTQQMFLYKNTAIIVHWINKGGIETSQQIAQYFLVINS